MKIFTAIMALCVLCGHAYAFNEKKCIVKNSHDGVELAGTLSTPDNIPRAALVLITGSGQQNRDEEVFGHKPFKCIAERLSDDGFAVLRLDDRGIGGSGGDFTAATMDDFVKDAEAALLFLREEYPGLSVGSLGHSEGGSVVIRLAAGNKSDFIISLAAPAWAGDSMIMSQSRALAMTLTGEWKAESSQRKLLDIAKGDLPDFVARPLLVSALADIHGNIPAVADNINAVADVMLSPHYRGLLRYNPTADIKAVKVPWLALNGSKDLQVLEGNLKTIDELCPSAETVLMNSHNHLFQHCSVGLPQEYAEIQEDISQETLDIISSWLQLLFPQNN